MATLPPRLIRRLIVTPLVFLLALAIVALSPVLVLIALVTDLVLRSRWRTTRLTVLAVVFAALEAVGIIAMLVLWIMGGAGLWLHAGWMRRTHYRFLKRWLNAATGALLLCLGLDIEPELQPPKSGAVLVFSRHAGPGDSLVISREIMMRFDRHPRIVWQERPAMGALRRHSRQSDPFAFRRPESAGRRSPPSCHRRTRERNW